MPAPRRVGSADSATRTAILDAAEKVMLEGGYAAVTSRSVAGAAGIHAGNVHYYFPTIDDLFLGLLARGAEKNMERMAAALVSRRPLEALWRLQTNRHGIGILDELVAAARHRTALAEEVSALARTARRMQTEAFRELLPQYGLDPDLFPPELFAAMLQGTALLVVREEALGAATADEAPAAAAAALIDYLESMRDLNKGSTALQT